MSVKEDPRSAFESQTSELGQVIDALEKYKTSISTVTSLASGVVAAITSRDLTTVAATVLAVGLSLFVGMKAIQRFKVRAGPIIYGENIIGLINYDEKDWELFQKLRTIEIKEAARKFSRDDCFFGILVGPTGAGKTSFLRAGLLPDLRQSGYFETEYYRDAHALLERLESIGQENGAGQIDPVPIPTDDVADEERARCEDGTLGDQTEPLAGGGEEHTRLLIVCDQFERFFQETPDRAERDLLYSKVRDILNNPERRVSIIFSLQDDYFHRMMEFDEFISEPLASENRYTLNYFTRDRAVSVISILLPDIDPDYRAKLADDLVEDDYVRPPELQVVLSRIVRLGLNTKERYTNYGHKDRIIHGFLKDVVEESPNPRLTRKVLTCFAGENDVSALTLQRIAERCKEREKDTSVAVYQLIAARILGKAESGDEFRLVHAYLGDRIRRFLGLVEDAAYRADLLLGAFLAQARIDQSTRIPLWDVPRISRASTMMEREDARALIQRSVRVGVVRAALSLLLITATTVSLTYVLSPTTWKRAVHIANAHEATVARAVFTDGGDYVLSAGWDLSLRLWNALAASDPLEAELPELGGVVVDFSYNEIRNIVIAATFTDLYLVDLHTRSVRHIAEGVRLAKVAVNPIGRFFAVSDVTGRIDIRNVDTGAVHRTLRDAGSTVRAIQYDERGGRLGVVTPDNLRIWDLDAGYSEWSLPGSFWVLAFVPGADEVLVGDDMKRCLRVSLGSQEEPVLLAQYASRISAIDVSPSGQQAAIGTWGGNIAVIDLATGATAELGASATVIHALEFSDAGDRLLATSSERGFSIYEARKTTPIGDFRLFIDR